MNKEDYRKNVVSFCNQFHSALTVTDYDINWVRDRKYFINPEDWDMKISGLKCDLGDCWHEWYIGHCHIRHSSMTTMTINGPPWTYNDWYPFWGKSTKRKAILTLSIKKFWYEKKIKTLLNLLLLCRKKNIPDDLRYFINKLI